jgi:hypothetical protein
MGKSSKEKRSRTCENGKKNEGKGMAEANLKVHEERKDLQEDALSLPTEELNKRADDFIARVNRQRMLEARL